MCHGENCDGRRRGRNSLSLLICPPFSHHFVILCRKCTNHPDCRSSSICCCTAVGHFHSVGCDVCHQIKEQGHPGRAGMFQGEG